MAEQATTAGVKRFACLAACLALWGVLAAGSASRPAAAQEPVAAPQAMASDPGPAAASGIAASNGPEVISFSRALALVSAQNPQIAFANEQIREAFAQLRGAKVLWLPSIQAGINYQNHDGPVQDSGGTITVANRSALEAGLGMYAVGGGAPAIPGLSAKFAMADAVFQPRIAAQQAAARQRAAAATTDDFLLYVAVGYLDLLRAFQQRAIAAETLDHAQRLAQLTAEFARSGQGSQADADRAQTEAAVRNNAVAQAEVQTVVASARLAELLNLPFDHTLVPEEPTLVPIELVSRDASAAELVADGLSHRPELAASRNLIAGAMGQLDRERYAPLLPNLLLDVSQSGFGGGPESTVGELRGRFDFDATAYWQLRNFGWGEVAAREGARSRLEQARLVEVRLLNQVSREIIEAHAQSESLRGQIVVAESGIRVAGDSYRRNLERIRGGQGLPLELLQSLQALDQSRREYLRAVGDYDEWQFRLYRALGCPIPANAGSPGQSGAAGAGNPALPPLPPSAAGAASDGMSPSPGANAPKGQP
jgi:outer membrane protein TolC